MLKNSKETILVLETCKEDKNKNIYNKRNRLRTFACEYIDFIAPWELIIILPVLDDTS